jgi:hypothetical protein
MYKYVYGNMYICIYICVRIYMDYVTMVAFAAPIQMYINI